MRKNLKNFGSQFSRKNTRNFYKSRMYFMELLETLEKTSSVLKKITENFGRNFKL